MPVMTVDRLGDLLKATTVDFNRGKLTDISVDLQEYVALSQLMQKKRMSSSGGTAIEFRLLTESGQNFAWTAPYETDTVNRTEGLTTGTIPWRFAKNAYTLDVRESALNEGPNRLIDLVRVERHRMNTRTAQEMEEVFWNCPTFGTTRKPYGIPYYVPRSNTEGFNGTHYTGYSDCAGINATTQANWRPWTGQYTNVTKDDLVRKMRKASDYVRFKAPNPSGIATFDTGMDCQYYTNNSVKSSLEDLLEAQNEDLGKDIATYQNMTTFRGRPVQWVPYLDADTVNPVYGINWGVWETRYQTGWWGKETKVDQVPNNHNALAVWHDWIFNWVCFDRRQNFVLATNNTYPTAA
jgi:hypothetical protein